MPSLASAIALLLSKAKISSASGFAAWLLEAPTTVANIIKTSGFQAEAEAMEASDAAEAADAAAELDAARAAAAAARDEAAAAESRAAAEVAAARAGANAARAEVEAARAEAEAARAEAEAARAETIAAKEMARTYVATSTADAIIDEAMAMLEARDAALLQVQARHRIELQSMQLELHSAEQTSDRAACEQEVLRSEVAAAEERERGMAYAETTIGFFAEQVAARLQPLLQHPAETLNNSGGEGSGSSKGVDSGCGGEGVGSEGGGSEGSSGDDAPLLPPPPLLSPPPPPPNADDDYSSPFDSGPSPAERWQCNMCNGYGECSFDDSVCQTCGGTGWCSH